MTQPLAVYNKALVAALGVLAALGQIISDAMAGAVPTGDWAWLASAVVLLLGVFGIRNATLDSLDTALAADLPATTARGWTLTRPVPRAQPAPPPGPPAA